MKKKTDEDLRNEPAFKELKKILENAEPETVRRTFEYLKEKQEIEEEGEGKIYSLKEAAEMLKYNTAYLRKLCNDNMIRGKNITGKKWLITEKAIKEFLNKNNKG